VSSQPQHLGPPSNNSMLVGLIQLFSIQLWISINSILMHSKSLQILKSCPQLDFLLMGKLLLHFYHNCPIFPILLTAPAPVCTCLQVWVMQYPPHQLIWYASWNNWLVLMIIETEICVYSLLNPRCIFLSINRFERKKNIGLAISAFASLLRKQENVSKGMSIPGQDVRLVIAGELSQQIRFCLPGHS
jgi:glycosyltransferase involved in cell wall biosynthesis